MGEGCGSRCHLACQRDCVSGRIWEHDTVLVPRNSKLRCCALNLGDGNEICGRRNRVAEHNVLVIARVLTRCGDGRVKVFAFCGKGPLIVEGLVCLAGKANRARKSCACHGHRESGCHCVGATNEILPVSKVR